MTDRSPLRYGPELWRSDRGVEWSYWDLWFAVLCVRDHGGDWDGFDAALTKIGFTAGEAKWSHLLDLRERLAAAGLGAAELVGDTITEKGLVTRARARVFKQSLSVHDMTPAMRNPPARRLEKRGRRGWWPRFPSSPQDPHDRLLALLGLDRLFASSATISWDATNDLAGDLDAAAGALADLRLADGDRAGALAVRRAVLTIGLNLMECCDDSSGYLGHAMTTAMRAYADTDWRSTGMPPQDFWPDFVEIATLLANYGVPVGEEVEVYRLAGVAPDLGLVCGIADGLHAEYTAARMTWHAGQVRQQRAHALAATGVCGEAAEWRR